MKNIIITILTKFINIINIIINKLTKNNNLTISSIIHNDSGRFYQYYLTNNKLLSHKEVLNGIYNTLISDETFKNFGKYKVIIISAIYEKQEVNFHPNILLTNNTSFEEYYNKVKNVISTQFNKGYKRDIRDTPTFEFCFLI
jgi:deoxyhypusine synthase